MRGTQCEYLKGIQRLEVHDLRANELTQILAVSQFIRHYERAFIYQ